MIRIGMVALLLAGLSGAAWSQEPRMLQRTPEERAADQLNVRDFADPATGKACTTDWSPCFNAAFEAVRKHPLLMHTTASALTLTIPAGLYPITHTINLTAIKLFRFYINAAGAVIVAATHGTPAVDALGSRFLSISGLEIYGEGDGAPSIGLQMGVRNGDEQADMHTIQDLQLSGSFTLAGLYLRSTETSSFNNLRISNDGPNPSAYDLILDGLNHFAVTSAFTEVTLKPDQDLSFNEPMFNEADLRSQHGPLVFATDVARMRFIGSYFATGAPIAVVLYSGPNGILQPQFDVHFEPPGLKVNFLLDLLPARNPHIDLTGFSYQDQVDDAQTAIFTTSPGVTGVTLSSSRLNVARMVRGAKVFSPEMLKVLSGVSGSFNVPDKDSWNASADVLHGCVTAPIYQFCAHQIIDNAEIFNSTFHTGPGQLAPTMQRLTPKDGGTQMLDTSDGVAVATCGNVFRWTLTLPPKPAAGDTVRVTAAANCFVGDLAVAATHPVVGAPKTLTPTAPFAFIFDAATNEWLRLP